MAVRRPFLFSYGGGHANIIIALARELQTRGVDFDLLGLTTARAAFERAGLSPMSLASLLDPATKADYLAASAPFTPTADNPDVSQADTGAYFAIGYGDLVAELGVQGAQARIASMGRKAFEPVRAFTRLFERLRPSVVVSTTAPRFEVAGLKAARRLGIPNIAVGDMYLIAEQDWIVGQEYADHLVVLSEEVADLLVAAGPLASELHVLGNPAFDALASRPDESQRRQALRAQLHLDEKQTCILWPLGGAPDLVMGRALWSPIEVAAFLEKFCAENGGFRYILRPHPNWPVASMALQYGAIDSALALEDAIAASDVCCVEASTVGLQAVLRGLPTIVLNFADYVLYPGFGWAASVDGARALAETLSQRRWFTPPSTLTKQVGGASARVANLVLALATKS